MSSFLDNALYPVLFARAVTHLMGISSAPVEWAMASVFILVLTYLNFRGIQIAGATAVALNVFLILPLVWLVVAAAGHARFSPFVPFRAAGEDALAQFGVCLALAMWLY